MLGRTGRCLFTRVSFMVASVGIHLMSEFDRLQQKAIDQKLVEMLPKEVNDMLSTMKLEEANDFLERLGRPRALAIYLILSG